MSERTTEKSPGAIERGSRFFRNINYLGAVAFTGAAVLFPAYEAPLLLLAAIDVVQAVGFDLVRGHAKKRRTDLALA